MRLTGVGVLMRLLLVSTVASAAWALSGRNVQQVTKKLDLVQGMRTGSDEMPVNALPMPPYQQKQQQQQPQTHLLPQKDQRIGGHAAKSSLKVAESRRKRSQRDIGEYKDLNVILEDLEQNGGGPVVAPPSIEVAPASEFDVENMPPLTYYLLLQKLMQLQNSEPTYRVRTPRLGRSIDFQLYDRPASTSTVAASSHSDASTWLGSDAGHHRLVNTKNGNNNDGLLTSALLVGDVENGGFGAGNGVGMSARQFWSRVNKKSVPFKPRLGKRGQLTCN